MSTATSAKPASDLDAIANDLATLKQDFAALIADLRAGSIGRAQTMAKEAADQISDKAANLYEHASSKADAGVKAVSREIEERPLTALMAAFAIGFVASRLLSR